MIWQPELHIPELPDSLENLAIQVKNLEYLAGYIKPDNEARIVWKHNSPQKTRFSLVYLHGFSASQGEAEPLHRQLADYMGANLYVSRLACHGTQPDDFNKLTAQNYLNSAIRAVEIGKKIGDKCIVAGSSTGALLALYLAASLEGIHGLYLYSPLLEFRDSAALLLQRKVIRLTASTFLSKIKLRRKKSANFEVSKYWYLSYPFRGVITLAELLYALSTVEVFQNVTQPVFMGYYYKSKLLQDPTVSVAAMLKMYNNLGTPLARKKKIAYPEAQSHVITSSLISSVYQEVLEDSKAFFDEKFK